jgi:ABC-type uncharacterized transport system YnjBCD substrate-binding protein
MGVEATHWLAKTASLFIPKRFRISDIDFVPIAVNKKHLKEFFFLLILELVVKFPF